MPFSYDVDTVTAISLLLVMVNAVIVYAVAVELSVPTVTGDSFAITSVPSATVISASCVLQAVKKAPSVMSVTLFLSAFAARLDAAHPYYILSMSSPEPTYL